MLEAPAIGLRIVKADDLEEEVKACLRPGDKFEDADGVAHRLPEYFYEIPSWEAAKETRLAPNFGLWELIDVDVREAEPVRLYPRFIPCALAILAGHLQVLRNEVGRVVRVAANGGYRSPSHELSGVASGHCWGTAANIYRFGDDWMDSRERIEKYVDVARRTLPAAWVRPYGEEPGFAFDHLHVDLGYFAVEPHSSRGRDSEG